MKLFDGYKYTFECDGCHTPISQDRSEQIALRLANDNVAKHGWEWRHPHWGLLCNECLEYEKKKKQAD